jgi:hypothetical protein
METLLTMGAVCSSFLFSTLVIHNPKRPTNGALDKAKLNESSNALHSLRLQFGFPAIAAVLSASAWV